MCICSPTRSFITLRHLLEHRIQRGDVLTLLSSGTPLMTMSLEYSRLQLLLMFSGGLHVQFRVQIWINEQFTLDGDGRIFAPGRKELPV